MRIAWTVQNRGPGSDFLIFEADWPPTTVSSPQGVYADTQIEMDHLFWTELWASSHHLISYPEKLSQTVYNSHRGHFSSLIFILIKEYIHVVWKSIVAMTHFFTFSSPISKGSHPQLLQLISLVCIAMFLNNILILLSLDLPVLEIIVTFYCRRWDLSTPLPPSLSTIPVFPLLLSLQHELFCKIGIWCLYANDYASIIYSWVKYCPVIVCTLLYNPVFFLALIIASFFIDLMSKCT